jgi:hypothetical protein
MNCPAKARNSRALLRGVFKNRHDRVASRGYKQHQAMPIICKLYSATDLGWIGDVVPARKFKIRVKNDALDFVAVSGLKAR